MTEPSWTGGDVNPRMEALAQVAGGVSPALSDLLTVIRGQAALLLNSADLAAGSRAPLIQISTAAERAVSLLRQLLIFSGQQAMRSQPLALNGLIEESAATLRQLVGTRIALDFDLAGDLPQIVADREMIEQVLIILALNACDAMPAGGRLGVKTAVVDLPGELTPHPPVTRTGRFVLLQVDDTGCGIAPEFMARIFEPFLTTNAAGRSTGLGLATVHGIARQHQGWVTAASVVGTGSSFRVFLPPAPAGTSVETGRIVAAAGDRRGHETILLVEDEATVREYTAILLKEHGYRVLQASSVAEALEVWKWHAARIKLLFTDMVLEDSMSGFELAIRLRAEAPSLMVICTSGDQRTARRRLPGPPGGYHFLSKPCRPETLLTTVRALLGAPAA